MAISYALVEMLVTLTCAFNYTTPHTKTDKQIYLEREHKTIKQKVGKQEMEKAKQLFDSSEAKTNLECNSTVFYKLKSVLPAVRGDDSLIL